MAFESFLAEGIRKAVLAMTGHDIGPDTDAVFSSVKECYGAQQVMCSLTRTVKHSKCEECRGLGRFVRARPMATSRYLDPVRPGFVDIAMEYDERSCQPCNGTGFIVMMWQAVGKAPLIEDAVAAALVKMDLASEVGYDTRKYQLAEARRLAAPPIPDRPSEYQPKPKARPTGG